MCCSFNKSKAAVPKENKQEVSYKVILPLIVCLNHPPIKINETRKDMMRPIKVSLSSTW